MNDYIPHLIEFRKRLIQSVCFFVLIFLILFYFDETLYSFFAKPLLTKLPSGGKLIATEITSTFMVPMKLALICALLLSVPYFLFQIWTFIAPGLYLTEKKTLFPFMISSILLFYLGLGFGYAVICPMALGFFAHSAPEGVLVMTDIRYYLDFVSTLVFSSGVAFQVPVITLAFLKAGWVTLEQLSSIRPYVIVGAFVLGMLLTPPDIVSQILLALPMWGLYELALFFSKYRVFCQN